METETNTTMPDVIGSSETPDGPERPVYCIEAWEEFWFPYNSVDSYVRLIVCAIGIILNVFNILVFSRKVMRNPTNTILLALSVTDLLCVTRKFLERVLYFYRLAHGDDRSSLHIFVEAFLNEIFFSLFHSWSIYLTLAASMWRYMGVLRPFQSRAWLTNRNAKWTIFASILISSTFVLFRYIGVSISASIEFPNSDDNNGTFLANSSFFNGSDGGGMMTNGTLIYEEKQTHLGEEISVWTRGILIKIVPCILLSILTAGLLISLLKVSQIRTELRRDSGPNSSSRKMSQNSIRMNPLSLPINPSPTTDSLVESQKTREKRSDSNASTVSNTSSTSAHFKCTNVSSNSDFDKTNKVLIGILLLFLVTEFPFGLLTIVQALMEDESDEFFYQCYEPILRFFNLCEYISSAANFFIYFTISDAFRHQLLQIFTSSSLFLRLRPSPYHSRHQNSRSTQRNSATKKSVSATSVASSSSSATNV